MGNLLGFGLFVFGFVVWRWASRRIFGSGSWHVWGVLVLGVVSVPAMALPKPAGYPDTVIVAFQGKTYTLYYDAAPSSLYRYDAAAGQNVFQSPTVQRAPAEPADSFALYNASSAYMGQVNYSPASGTWSSTNSQWTATSGTAGGWAVLPGWGPSAVWSEVVEPNRAIVLGGAGAVVCLLLVAVIIKRFGRRSTGIVGAVLLALVVSPAAFGQVLPPDGAANKFHVSLNGFAFQGAIDATWNGTVWQGTRSTPSFAAFTLTRLAASSWQLDWGNGAGGIIRWTSASTLPGAPWTCTIASGVTGLTVSNAGTPDLRPVDSISGNQYSDAAVEVILYVAEGDALWRNAAGAKVVPSILVNQVSTFVVVYGQDWPFAGYNWDAGGVAFSKSHRLPMGFGPQSGTFPEGSLPKRFWAGEWMVPTFGGYGVIGFDVVPAVYEEVNFNFVDSDSGGALRTRSLPLYGVKAGAGAPERWLLVVSTEADTRRPYLEIRKPNGERYRFYAPGHVLDHRQDLATPMIYTDDGFTPSPMFIAPDPGGTQGQVPSQHAGSGFFAVFDDNNTSDATYWPAPGLPADAQFDSSPNAPIRSQQTVIGTGVGSTTGTPTADGIIDKIRADPRRVMPTWLSAETGLARSASSAEAYADMQAVFGFFGQTSELDWGLKNNAQTLNLGTHREAWDMLLTWPDQAAAFSPGLFLAVRWVFGVGLVLGTVMYCFNRLAWAFSLRNPEEVAPPVEVPTL